MTIVSQAEVREATSAPRSKTGVRMRSVLHWRTNCRDVTDVCREQHPLHHRERASGDIVASASASDALAVLDAAGRIIYGNPKFAELIGQSNEQLVGQRFDLLGFPDTASSGTLMAVKSDIEGENRWLRVLARVLVSMEKDPERTVVVIVDDTDRVLLHRRARATERLQLLGRFASGVAHDFNNVLSAVRGHAELLVEALPPATPPWSDAQAIVRGADRAATLVQQLLDFARGQELEPTLVDINEVAADAAEFCEPLLLPAAQVKVLRRGPLMVFVDPAQMRRCIANIILNARDAIADAGTITVTVEAVGDTAVVRVEDTGCGMTGTQMDEAFEPFFTTKPTGTGLGLDAVCRLVTESGGAIDVSSVPDIGTSVTLRLPLTSE